MTCKYCGDETGFRFIPVCRSCQDAKRKTVRFNQSAERWAEYCEAVILGDALILLRPVGMSLTVRND